MCCPNREDIMKFLGRASLTSKMIIFLTCKGIDHVTISKLLNRSYSSTRKIFNNAKRSLYFSSLPNLVCSFYELGIMEEPTLSSWYKGHPSEETIIKVRSGEIECLSDQVG